jgi:hypothetical protein
VIRLETSIKVKEEYPVKQQSSRNLTEFGIRIDESEQQPLKKLNLIEI